MKRYLPHMTARLISRSQYDLCESVCRRISGEVAIQDEHQALSWEEVDDALNRCANGLQAADLGPDTRIAVFAENSVETALANLGGLVAGASVVPVNFHLTAEEVAYILSDSEARILFVGPETAERGIAAAAESNVHTVIGWGDSGSAVPWSDWLVNSESHEPDETVPPRPNLLYTSGTTGRPKGQNCLQPCLREGIRWPSTLVDLRQPRLNVQEVFVVRNWWLVRCITRGHYRRPASLSVEFPR